MPQVTLYIDDDTQASLRNAAARNQVSQSQFVAELIRHATRTTWPDEVLALAGSLTEFPSAEELRAGMGVDAPRVAL